jgi:cytochrome c oxidase subunit I+III
MLSTVGAFILAAGIVVFVWDVVRPKGRQPFSERNPWNAGTLEWLAEMPSPPWGVRSIPEIDSRYPLWDQPNFVRDVDEGNFYLPDAEEGRRETLVTTAIDAEPVQCLRVAGNSFMPLLAALFTGGIFIFSTYKLWWLALASGIVALITILTWLWSGTSRIPEKPQKDVGLGLSLPLYTAGPASVGWWGVFITMLADITAFISIVFGYFFYWTARPDFVPAREVGPGVTWPSIALALLLGSWLLTVAARRWNLRDASLLFHGALAMAVVLAIAGSGALVTAPWITGLDPTASAYAATVWTLVVWTAAHAGVGVIMQLYCLARRAAGRMTPQYGQDIANVAVYWHFVAITVAITVAVIAGAPLVL